MLANRSLGFAVLLVLSSTVASAAAPATVERGAKLRSGPGAGYRVIATLPRGLAVDVGGCNSGWCEVVSRGRRGYVSHSLLALAGGPPAVAATPRPLYEYDYDYPGFDFPGPTYGPAVSVTVTPRWSHRRWSRSRYQWGARGWRAHPAGSSAGVRSPERPAVGRAGGLAPAPTSSLGATVDTTRPTVGIVPDAARSGPATKPTASPVVTAPAVPAMRDGR